MLEGNGNRMGEAAPAGGFAALCAAVQANCHVTDARHARNMTLCTYLLEMREFCRWERRAALTAPLPRADVGAWIAGREALWETLEDADYGPLPVAGEDVDPYDTSTVNRTLVPQGHVYGAGIGRFGKPQFFLGVLEREEWRDGLRILVAGRELARDLSAAPAALRDDTVSIRLESLARVLWERAEAWALKRPDGALKAALDAHRFDPADAASLDRMVAAEAETLILHELGERAAGRTLGPGWEEMLAGFARRRAELFARAVRDHLADCLVTLPTLMERDAPAPIHFWFANLDGLRRELFPRAIGAYEAWRGGDCGRALRAAVAAGVDHWRRVCANVLRVGDGSPDTESAIETFSLAPALRL